MPNSRANDDIRRPEREPLASEPAGGAREAPDTGRTGAPGAATPAPGAPSEVEALRGELAGLRDELARADERYKRALADLDNYRKRSAREADRRIADARDALLRDWLEALDSVERALRLQPEDQGQRAVLEQMEAILARQGVRRLGAAGERFDPELHEAVGVRPADGVPDRTIVEVARSGFALGEDRVLRPAQVVVSRRAGGEG
jgi:molecular chaperone GrpE